MAHGKSPQWLIQLKKEQHEFSCPCLVTFFNLISYLLCMTALPIEKCSNAKVISPAFLLAD
jgi:hypothetical protein